MSSLSFHSRSAVSYLSGRQVQAIVGQAQSSLETTLRRPECRRLRNQLRLPAPGSAFFSSRLFSLILGLDGDDVHVDGHDVHLIDLARQVRYEQEPRYGILGWLFGNAITHGWVAGPDRAAMAGEIDAAVAASPESLSRDAWAGATAFLRDGEGDVVLSMSHGTDFPDLNLAWDSGAWKPAVRNAEEPWDELEVLWGTLSSDAQWDLAFTAIQSSPELRWHAGRYGFCDFTIGQGGSLVPSSDGGRCHDIAWNAERQEYDPFAETRLGRQRIRARTGGRAWPGSGVPGPGPTGGGRARTAPLESAIIKSRFYYRVSRDLLLASRAAFCRGGRDDPAPACGIRFGTVVRVSAAIRSRCRSSLSFWLRMIVCRPSRMRKPPVWSAHESSGAGKTGPSGPLRK